MEQFDIECLVVGAGVVGLAVARELAKQGKEVVLVEQTKSIGNGISSRNSEVIHAGIYYPKDSLKAKLCVEGKNLLYSYCLQHQIPHQKLGKLIVAQNEAEMLKLESIHKHAIDNGVDDLRYISQQELSLLEPELSSIAALYSPSTGIIDSHAYMLQLQADFENAGGQCIFNTKLKAIDIDEFGIHLESESDGTKILAKQCVNATGLNAISFCQDLKSFAVPILPKAYFAKGSYFSYQGKVPFKHLIYPVPVNGGLGVHLTLDMNNSAKFGPDVEWLLDNEPLNYKVDESKKSGFVKAVKSYWPNLNESRLCADYSGIRPKISGPSETAADFCIQAEEIHGIKGYINLFGIESPGLTASLAIAELVVAKLK
ncbi:MAG: L-2-hydroxyglutarate oxidase LhgO [Oleiphilaceae bacterium]|jgi:L-2-hydroxyglutarate oxidase LhgO